MFVLGISSWYLLKGRDVGFALRSIAVASGFGLASILSVIILGDESGYATGEVQKVKLAAIEAEWHTEPAPAAFTLVGIPNQAEERTDYAVKIPYLLGLIATRSVDEEVTGLIDLKNQNEVRIRSGMQSYADLQRLKSGDVSEAAVAAFETSKEDLGYGLLLKKYTPEVTDATETQIKQAAADTIPNVFTLFWSFRIMVAMGVLMLFIFAASFYYTTNRTISDKKWLLRLALYSIPAPWIAAEMGWIVAEMGRQPWTISGILPTHLSTSSLSSGDLYFSLAGFLGFYTLLLIVELFLMFRYARLGPSSLHTGRYYFEKNQASASHA
jgi:cytochrome d ubiquinol oxidase subunit I